MWYVQFLRNQNCEHCTKYAQGFLSSIDFGIECKKLSKDCKMYFMSKKETDVLDGNHTPKRVTLLSRYA